MGSKRGLSSAWAGAVIVAAFARLRLCLGEHHCLSAWTVAEWATDGAHWTAPSQLEAAAQEPGQLELMLSERVTSQQFTWLIPTDGALEEAEVVNAAAERERSMFTRVVALQGIVEIPERGGVVEARTTTGANVQLFTQESGTVRVSSVNDAVVAFISPEAGGSDTMMPRSNIGSCSGIVHVITGVEAGSESVMWDTLHAAHALATPKDVSVRRARRLLRSSYLSQGGQVVGTHVRMLQESLGPGPAPAPAPASAVAVIAGANTTMAGNVSAGLTDPPSAGPVEQPPTPPKPQPPSDSSPPASGPVSPDPEPTGAEGTDSVPSPRNVQETQEGPPTPPEGGGSSGLGPPVLAGIAAAAILLLIVCATIAFVWNRRRRRKRPQLMSSKSHAHHPYAAATDYDQHYANSTQFREAGEPPAPSMPPPAPGKPGYGPMHPGSGHHMAPPMHTPDSPTSLHVQAQQQRAISYAQAGTWGAGHPGEVGHRPHNGNDIPPSALHAPAARGHTSQAPAGYRGSYAAPQQPVQHHAPAAGAAVGTVAAASQQQDGRALHAAAASRPEVTKTPGNFAQTEPIAGARGRRRSDGRSSTPKTKPAPATPTKPAAARSITHTVGASSVPPREQGSSARMAAAAAKAAAPQAMPLPIVSHVRVPAHVQDDIARLEQRLMQLGQGSVLGGRYELVNNLCQSKESSIVMNVAGVSDSLRYVMTFFLVKEHFDAECALYETAALRGLVPRAHIFVDNDALTTPDGVPLPPAIVLERGETLGEWATRRSPDAHVKAEVLRHIAMRIRALHEAGYVHCNISPAAVKWYPRENRWMLCEFGHAARAGDHRRAGAGGLTDTDAAYAAPEGIAVVEEGGTQSLGLRSNVVAKAPLDVWSYAVLALELMFGSPLLDASNGQQVRAQLGGEQPLPWEDPRMSGQIAHQVGDTYATVLVTALQRDPHSRPSMATLHDDWRKAQKRERNEQESASDLL